MTKDIIPVCFVGFIILILLAPSVFMGISSLIDDYKERKKKKQKGYYFYLNVKNKIPYLVANSKNKASKLVYVENKDEMANRLVYLSLSEGLWFIPCTKKDKYGRQMGTLSNNKYGLKILKDACVGIVKEK